MKQLFNISAFLILFCPVARSQSGCWTQKANIGVGRVAAVGFSIGTKGYIGTGYDGFSWLSDFWEWDQATDTWSQKASIPAPARELAVGFSIGTKGYIGTGRDSAVICYNDFWEWDQTTNIWLQKASLPASARWAAVGFSIGNKGYIGTGRDNNFLFSDFWEYDPLSDIWSQKANYPFIREHAVGFSIGNKGYIGTGNWTGSTVFCEYDQSLNVWTGKANFSGTPRTEAVGFSIGNKGYIGTGNPSGFPGNFNDFCVWDQSTDTWTQSCYIPTSGRSLAVAFSIGTKGYCGTGLGGALQDLWELDALVGTEDIEKLQASIYPNPSNGNFSISINEKEFTVTVYDVSGKVVCESKNEKQINITDKPSGIYFLRITTKEGTVNRKIIKE